MAVRKPVAQKVIKQKKNHGPKRKLFHDWTSTMRLHFANAGLLDKYSNYESFAISCGARGVRTDIAKLWEDYSILPDKAAKDNFLKNLTKKQK